MIATAFTAGYGAPRVSPFLAQIACVAAVTMIGQAMGTKLPWYLGAPICAAAVYLTLGFLSFKADSILLSLTPVDERRTTFEPIKSWVLLTQAIFWLTIAIHLLLRRSGFHRTASLTIIAAGLVASPLLLITPNTRYVDTGAARQDCEPIPHLRSVHSRAQGGAAGTSMTLCLPRGKQVVRAQLAPELNEASVLIAGLLPNSVAFLDDEAAHISRQVDENIDAATAQQRVRGAKVVMLSQAGDISAYTRIDADQVQYGLIAYFVPPTSLTAPNDATTQSSNHKDPRPIATPSDVLWRWYLTKVGARIDGLGPFGGPALDDKSLNYEDHEASVRFLDALSTAERTAWFARHAGSIRHGKLSWAAFGSTT